MNPALLQLPAAFGLAGASGLNASLPLLVTSLLARLGYIHLASPFNALQSDIAFYGLLVLAAVEFVADKVPLFDSFFQVAMLPIAGASGAILFAAQTDAVHHVSPGLVIVLSLLAGAVTAGAIHTSRTAVRPVANLALLGPLASTIEDALAVGLVLAAFLAPLLIPGLLLLLAGVLYLLIGRLRRSR